MAIQLFFDHRVLDAVPVARALVDLEETLNTQIAAELTAMRAPQPAPAAPARP